MEPWMNWDGFKDLIEGNPPIGGEGGELPPELIDKINSSASKEEVKEMMSKMNHSKDIVFKMSSPLKIGPQDSTDMPFPHDGVAQLATISISHDSSTSSNILLSIEKYDKKTKTWNTMSGTIMLAIGETILVEEVEHEIKKNDKLRINILEGELDDIKDLTVILNIA